MLHPNFPGHLTKIQFLHTFQTERFLERVRARRGAGHFLSFSTVSVSFRYSYPFPVPSETRLAMRRLQLSSSLAPFHSLGMTKGRQSPLLYSIFSRHSHALTEEGFALTQEGPLATRECYCTVLKIFKNFSANSFLSSLIFTGGRGEYPSGNQANSSMNAKALLRRA